MTELALQQRVEELERKLNESEQTVRSLMSGEIDTILHQDSTTPLLLMAAQARLRANERLFRAVFDGTASAMVIANDNGFCVDANTAACALFGLPRETLMGHSIGYASDPIFGSPGIWAQFPRAGRNEGEFRLTRADGSERDVDYRATPNILPGLNLSVLRDMTELRRTESRFRTMIERSHDGIGLVDAKGGTIYASPAVARMLGEAPPLESAGKLGFVYPADRARLNEILARLIANPSTPLSNEFRVLRADGSLRWVAATASNFLDDPAVGAVVGNLQDVTERKVAEAALRQSQRSLEDAQAIAHLGSWTSENSTERVSWSAECARIFGRELDEPPTMADLIQLVHPQDRARVAAAYARAIHGGRILETEHRVSLPGDEVRWVYMRTVIEAGSAGIGDTAQTLQGGAGPTIRATGVVQDITDRKRAEEALRASDLRYRRIVDNTLEGIWMYDDAGMTTFVNPRLAEMLGCSVEEMLGKPVFAFMHDSAHEAACGPLARRKLGDVERGDFPLKRRDGSDLWVSIHATPLFDASGKFESALALLTDITDRRRADETRNRLASIVASSDDAIISRGVDGIIRTWNRAAEKLTQYSAAEAVGRSIDILYPPERAAQLDAIRARVDDGERLQQFEMACMRKDGTLVDVAITASVLVDDTDVIQGVSIIARDVTERRASESALYRSEEQLRQAQKMEAIGSLAGGVAHDFNNLLSVILSYTSLMVEELKPTDPLRADVEEVHKAGMRATTLTRQLLAFSRQQMLQPIVLDLNRIVANIENLLARLLREDIQLELLPAPLPSYVYADAGQIDQVITNLVVNARDAMPNGGSLIIETALVTLDKRYVAEHVGVVAGPYVSLTVTDTGTGMDAATQAHIFEPFFTTKESSKGTGLGLSTVYGIVQQSGGHIQVDSKVGKGTTFTVYLPRTDRSPESDAPIVTPLATLRGTETILLVEDEEQVLTVMRSILRRHGYNVLEARNGGEAFLICEQFTAGIDLLLTDIVMPRMNGRQLAERLLSLRPSMKVLFVSGYTDNAIVHPEVVAPGLGFLQKPILPATLLEKIRQLLGSSPVS